MAKKSAPVSIDAEIEQLQKARVEFDERVAAEQRTFYAENNRALEDARARKREARREERRKELDVTVKVPGEQSSVEQDAATGGKGK